MPWKNITHVGVSFAAVLNRTKPRLSSKLYWYSWFEKENLHSLHVSSVLKNTKAVTSISTYKMVSGDHESDPWWTVRSVGVFIGEFIFSSGEVLSIHRGLLHKQIISWTQQKKTFANGQLVFMCTSTKWNVAITIMQKVFADWRGKWQEPNTELARSGKSNKSKIQRLPSTVRGKEDYFLHHF